MATNNAVNVTLAGQLGTGNFTGSNTSTFIPTLGGSGADPTSVTYSQQIGKYTQIGNVLYFYAQIVVTAVTLGGASGNLEIRGLPVASVNTANLNAIGTAMVANTAIPALSQCINFLISPGTTRANLFTSITAAANGVFAVTTITSTSQFFISGFYFTS